MACAQDYVRYCCKCVLEECLPDLEVCVCLSLLSLCLHEYTYIYTYMHTLLLQVRAEGVLA